MKAFKLIAIGLMLAFAGTASAQLSVRVNIGTPPAWGPSGYDDVRYYYLPDVEAYYDVQSSMFIFFNGRYWIHRSYLPSQYSGYDLYGGYKVVMTEYRGNYPYAYYKHHKTKYKKGYRGHPQHNYGNKPGKGNNHRGYSTPNHGNKSGKGNNHRGYSPPNNHSKPIFKDNKGNNGNGNNHRDQGNQGEKKGGKGKK